MNFALTLFEAHSPWTHARIKRVQFCSFHI